MDPLARQALRAYRVSEAFRANKARQGLMDQKGLRETGVRVETVLNPDREAQEGLRAMRPGLGKAKR